MMTGTDAWSIIAPILAAHMERIPHERDGQFTGLNLLDEAYVIACGALQRYDEWEKQRKEDAP